MRLALIALAGASGTLARYGVQVALAARAANPAVATAVVNVLGCFLLGACWSLLHGRGLLASDVRLVVVTGFLGAFTTFSALLLDTARLTRDASALVAAGNVAGQLLAGAVALGIGFWLGRLA